MTVKFSVQNLDNQAMLVFALGAPTQIRLVKNIWLNMQKEWDQLRNPETQQHLIDGIVFSSTKTDAIKTYVEKISALVFNSIGGWQRGFTKTQISEKHNELIAAISNVNSSELNHALLFTAVASSIFGYDKRIIAASIVDDALIASTQTVLFLQSRFEILAEDLSTSKEEKQDEPEVDPNPYASMYGATFLTNLTDYQEEIYNEMAEDFDMDQDRFFRKLLATTNRQGS